MEKAVWGTFALAFLLGAGCVGEKEQEAAQQTCAYTYECPTGFVCEAGRCLLAEWDASYGSLLDAQSPDATLPADAQVEEDASSREPIRVPFAPSSYRLCRDDLECAVFGGNCLIEVYFNRPDTSGADRIALSEIQPSLAQGQGICTLPCTTDPRVCETLVVDRPGGASVPFTCQLIYAAESPYPAAPPAFPFAAQLDEIALGRGVPFASICRPPFQYAEGHSAKFCEPCVDDDSCAEGDRCLMERAHATPASGSCVQGCAEQAECPVGFACEALEQNAPEAAQKYCVPLEGTCGRCLDADGDLRGIGRCGPLGEPNTDVDCDDSNPQAFHDTRAPNHPFPRTCGEQDFNCNGLSDRAEQLGSEQHCSTCNDVCLGRAGDIANSHRACQESNNAFQCLVICDEGYGDCDGQAQTGCEARFGEDQRWASDQDGDGRGSRTETRYFCDGAVPASWVKNRFDCDDNHAGVYGGGSIGEGNVLSAAPELCDGLDNDCNGIADDPGSVVGEGAVCVSGLHGVCAAGRQFCASLSDAPPAIVCVPDLTLEQQADAIELCDGIDNNCNGLVDDGADYFAEHGETNPNGPGAAAPCQIEGGLGVCSQGVWTCGQAGWSCVGTVAAGEDVIDADGEDENCDGSDGNLSAAVFVRLPGAGTLDGNDNNDGTAQRPVATLARALAVACAGNGICRDIYLQDGAFASNQAVRVPPMIMSNELPHVRVYGGFSATVICDEASCNTRWVRGAKRSAIVREAPDRADAPYPYGESYAGIEARSAGTLSLLLDQVDLSVRAPEGALLQNGDSAPAQVGIQCPALGCSQLRFRNVNIEVERALDGGTGGAAETPRYGLVDGRDGCTANTNCTPTNYPFRDNEWMEFWSEGDVSGLNSFGGRGEVCATGRAPDGGNSGGYRWRPPAGGDRLYQFCLNSGGCRAWDDDNNLLYPIAQAVRGRDGFGGNGGSYSGNGRFYLNPGTAVSWSPGFGYTYQYPGNGWNGGGGGGGGGCINRDGYFSCQGASVRGGGGGAGGCAGLAGANGGRGGHAIGMILVAPPDADLRLGDAYDLAAPPTGFAIGVGDGGRGGDGSPGSNAAPGGYGGRVGSDGTYRPEYQGANGGNGGGGGGGAGGAGGVSLGLVRQCTRADGNLENGCFMRLPPRFLAEPAAYISVGEAGGGGNGGAGGQGGIKPVNPNLSDNPTPNVNAAGADGTGGADAFAQTIFFLGN